MSNYRAVTGLPLMARQHLSAMVLDDHTYMRASMCSSLADVGITNVTEATSLEAARGHVRFHGRPTIAVTDLRLTDGSAMELISELTEVGTKVVVYTTVHDRYLVRSAYAAGAVGFMIKTLPHSAVLETLSAVLEDRTHVDGSVAALLVQALQDGPEVFAKELTVREVEVLRLASHGMSNQQIADHLGVTLLAVKGHFVRMGRKLGARDRAHMVAQAMRANLVA